MKSVAVNAARTNCFKKVSELTQMRKPAVHFPALVVAAVLTGCGSSGSSDPVLDTDPEDSFTPSADSSAPSADSSAPTDQPIIVVPSTVTGESESTENSPELPSDPNPESGQGIVEEPNGTPTAPEENNVQGAEDAPDGLVDETTTGDETIIIDDETTVDEETTTEETVVELESEPPTSPGEVLSIEYSGYDVELFWTRSTDDGWVMGYDIYRNGVLMSPMLDALSFYDDTVQPDTEYTYEVIAVDDHGINSEPVSLALTTPAERSSDALPSNFAVLRGGDSASWEIGDGLGTSNGMPSGGSCIYDNGAGSGVGITDAWTTDQGDAFDLASLMWVNGEQLGGYLRSATESTSNYATFPIAGLVASTEFHAVSTQPVIRHYTSFSNGTSDDIFVIVNFVSNFGSDGSTSVVGSSNGDLEFDADDRWVISDDFDMGDPTNTTVFFGPDSPMSNSVFTTESVFDCAGNQGFNARIDLTIPAGESRALMFFHAMSSSVSLATDLASQFDTTPAFGSDLVEGLSDVQLQAVANWVYQ